MDETKPLTADELDSFLLNVRLVNGEICMSKDNYHRLMATARSAAHTCDQTMSDLELQHLEALVSDSGDGPVLEVTLGAEKIRRLIAAARATQPSAPAQHPDDIRCIFCGQVDEPGQHDNSKCPGFNTTAVPLTVDDAAVRYILRYGGMCQGCTDEDGICPSSGPCKEGDKAVRFVLEAFAYGTKYGFIAAARAAQPKLCRCGHREAEPGKVDCWCCIAEADGASESRAAQPPQGQAEDGDILTKLLDDYRYSGESQHQSVKRRLAERREAADTIAHLRAELEKARRENSALREMEAWALGQLNDAKDRATKAEAELEQVKRERDGERASVQLACDLLTERTHGSRARSAGHNARLVLEAALSHPSPEGELREVALRWFMRVLSGAGGEANATEGAWNPLNVFFEDFQPTDTFNWAIDRGLARSGHDSDSDHSTVYITDAGRAFVAALSSSQEGGK
jgi:hypothetical protein